MPNKPCLTKEQFLVRAKAVHGERYCYEKSVYTKSREKLIITCRIHGDFLMKPNCHISLAQGCSKCADEENAKKRTTPFPTFVNQANHKHGEIYAYDQSSYVDGKTKTKISCRDHGDFYQSPNSHLSGSGCPDCARSGYDYRKKGDIYLLISDCGAYMKIGISNQLSARITRLKRKTPFKFNFDCQYKTHGYIARMLEKLFHEKGESCGFSGFEGATEWFKADHQIISELRNLSTKQPASF